MFFIIGLGNPGEEYRESRHNTGRMAVELFENKESGGGKATIIHSDEFMNHSGKAVAKFVKSKKAAENLIVVYDDIDLPLGTMKISFNKSSGGHRGLESIIKALKTKEFTRIRIGISPTTASGKIKKPGSNLSPKAAEKAMLDFILGKFKPSEMEILKKVLKKSSLALQSIILSGRDRAMNEFN
jgi:PTH1 family peptidyl-tRNA hydrolase